MKKRLSKYLIPFVLCLLSLVSLSQVKSTNVQTINGSNYYIHRVEKGHSLYSIAKLYNVSLDEIYLLNPELKNGVKANQEIKIPVKGAATVVTPTVSQPSNTVNPVVNPPVDTNLYYVHRVAKKETIYAIAKKYNITEAELKIMNPSLISQGPKEGQLLIVGEKKRVAVKSTEVKPNQSAADSMNLIRHPKKANYTVALILPFKLDQTLSLDLPALLKSKSAFPLLPAMSVDFYLGFKKAVDSLSGKDFEVNIELHDVDDKDSLKLVRIVNDPNFRQTDFIFGPLHANGFKTIAQKAKEFGIPIVSPLTQQNKMLYNNVYVSKTNPSQFTLLESLADYCTDSLLISNANIVLMAPFGNDAKEISYVKAFKKYFNERQKALGKTAKDTITVVKGIEGVKKSFVPNVRNVIVTLSNNQVFIADFTTQLAIFAENKDIVLCGWQNISSMDNIDQEYLNQLHFTFPDQNNITNTSAYGSLLQGYREQQNAFPREEFFIGFDVGYYYLKNLKESGADFIYTLNSLPAETNYMRFKFSRPDNSTGFDNRGVFIFRYNNYTLQKTGWK